MNEKILVTGGTGYIGSHTVVELLENNFQVVIIDNLINSKERTLSQIEKITGKRPEFHKLDLCNLQAVTDFFSVNQDITGIIHFAAFKAVGESVSFPMKYYHNNLTSLINLLFCLSTYSKPVKLVFSSSCAVYGDSDILPVSENLAMKSATSPYGRTKQIAEQMLQDYILTNTNLQAIALRYFNPIGAHPTIEIGEDPIKTYNLIPLLTATALQKRNELYVFGNDYDTADGTCVRDYIHVVDIAKAHIIALKRLLENENKNRYEYYNLGLGKGYSVLDIINTFEKVTSKKVAYKILERRTGDVSAVWASTKKANDILKWKADMTLEEMLLSAWQWELKKEHICC